MGGGERLHHAVQTCPPASAFDPVMSQNTPSTAAIASHSRCTCTAGELRRGRLRVVGHEREGLHEVKPSRFAQFLTAHFGQSADVFIPQPADAEHGVGRFAHPHKRAALSAQDGKCTAAILLMQWR